MAAADTEIERMVVRLIGDGTSFKHMLKQGVKDTDQFTRDVLGRLRDSRGKIAREFGKMDLGKTLTGAKLKEGVKIREQMATGAEKYANRMAKLNNLLQVGAIKQDTFDRASKKALDTLNAPIRRAQELDTKKKLAAQTAENKEWLKGQRDFHRQQGAQVKAWQKENDRLMKEGMRERARAEKEAALRLPKLGNRVSQVGANLKSVGTTGSFMISTPLIGVGTAAVSAAVKYNTAFTMIRALTGATNQEVDQFKQKIESLSVKTGRGPQELAEAMYFLASAGLKADKAMEALDVSAHASAVGLGETKVIADLMSSVLNAYGTENITATRAMDILVATVREGKGEAKNFAESLGFVIPIAAEMGVSFDQLGGAIAAMTQKGLQVDHSVTALKGILTQIISPAEQSTDALAALKIQGMGTFDELRAAIKERGLITVLNELYKAANGDVKIMGMLFPEVRGLTGVLNLLGQDVEKTIGIMNRVDKSTGSFDKAVRITADSVGLKLNQTMAELQLTLIDIGNLLLPLVLDLAKFVSESMKAWQGLSPEMKAAIITIAEFTAVLFPAIYVVGLMSSSIGSMITLYSLLGGTTGTAGVGMLRFAAAMGPVGAAVMIAAAAVLYLRNMLNEANAAADRAANKTDMMAENQLQQIRDMAGPDQKEAMDVELQRREAQLVSSRLMRDERQAQLNEENFAISGIRGAANWVFGADEMEKLNDDVDRAEKQVRAGEAFKREMAEAKRIQEAAAQAPDLIIGGEGGAMTKAEIKNLQKAKSQAESLRKANLSPEQKIAEDLQKAIESHESGNLSDDEFQDVVSSLHSRAESLQNQSPAAKAAREREKLEKRISDRSKTPAQKRAEEQKRLKELENGIAGDTKVSPFNREKAEEQVKKTNQLLAELVALEKEKKGQVPVVLNEAEGF